MKYPVFRGIQKPLILFGLKDKYIYQAVGMAALGLLLAVVLSLFLGLWGTLIGLAIGAVLVQRIYQRQDRRGMYPKAKLKPELFVYPRGIWNIRFKR